ncbi:MAG: beta-galactosidase [Eubacteriales bacterium]|nr:beta-galactosidase [Eubacteriales bacterium]
MNQKDYLAGSFPIGVKYAQHRDMQEPCWDMDFENMKNCGIDALRVHAFWAPIEPQEGVFDFGQYDRITEKAGAYGIKIMFTLYLMASPEWIFQKHPDSRFQSAAGTVWNSNQNGDNAHGGWPGLCFDSQPFRQTVEHFVGTFVEHYKGNPNVLAIDIWHEPTDEAATHGPENDWKEVMFCYCPHSIAGFKEWLKKKYGTLEEVNRVWTRHYNSWEELEPPRNMGTYTDWLDWKNYRLDAVTDSVRWLGQIVKKYDPDRATSVHTGILEMGHPITHADDHFRLADTTDMFACSLYESKKAELGGLTADLMRSACDNGPYWIGETGTGSGPIFNFLGADPEDFHCFSRALEPEEIFRLTWSHIARGAKGIFFWAWRPDRSTIEQLSLGFTERDGGLTDRTEALTAFTGVFRQYRERLAHVYAPESDVCILYNMDSMIIEGIVSVAKTASGFVNFKENAYKDMISFVGCYQLCMKNGIQPDFISKERTEQGGLAKYKVLILPYSVSITSELAKAIEDFVKNGGTVISDAMLGFFTDDGWGSEVCPPGGLDRVFGLSTSGSYDLIRTCEIDLGQKRYEKVGRYVSERIRVQEGAQVEASFPSGRPAIVTNRFGEGKTVYVGTLFFAAALKEGLSYTNELFGELLALAEYEGDKRIENIAPEEVVEVRRLLDEKNEFVFVINQTENTVRPRIRVQVSGNGPVTEILTGRTEKPVTEKELLWEGELKPMETAVFLIEKQ